MCPIGSLPGTGMSLTPGVAGGAGPTGQAGAAGAGGVAGATGPTGPTGPTGTTGPTGAVGYQGPGDVVASASGWWGLRAYNLSNATNGSKAIQVLRSGDNSTMDIVVLSTGDLDKASAQTFSTVVATGTGSIAGTTLTFTGSLTTNQLVTGAGVASGTVITGGASPTWTVNISQTVLSETLTIRQGLYVQILYDQSGNSNNLTNSGSTFQGGLLVFDGGPSGTLSSIKNNHGYGGSGSVLSQPYTFSWVAVRTSGFTTQQAPFGTYHGSNAPSDVFFTSANTIALSITADATVSATDSVWHAEQSIYSGSSSISYLDGSATTGLNPGSATNTSGHVYMGNVNGGSNFLAGNFVEGGIWGSGFNSTQYAAMNTNQHTYWGF